MATGTELRQLDDTELLTRYAEAKEELFNLRFQHATGQLDATSRLGAVKKDIARIGTIVRERQIEAAEVAGASAPDQAPSDSDEREGG